jgi:hypothetical protein
MSKHRNAASTLTHDSKAIEAPCQDGKEKFSEAQEQSFPLSDNRYTRDSDADAAIRDRTAITTDLINAMSAMLAEQRKSDREQMRFDRETVTTFKTLFDDTPLKWWIIFAGVGGLVDSVRFVADGVRLVVDAGVFLWQHYQYMR